MTKKNRKKVSFQQGAAALPAIMALAMILLLAGLAMTMSGLTQNNIVQNQSKSAMALYIAESGIKDAMQKAARNKDYDTSVIGSYSLTINGGIADIAVTKPISGQTQIMSAGSFNNNTRKLRAILDVSPEGKITINSWEELSS